MVMNNRLTQVQFPSCPLIINNYKTSDAHLTHCGFGINTWEGLCLYCHNAMLFYHQIMERQHGFDFVLLLFNLTL